MSRLDSLTTGIIQRPLGLIIYGPGGVGKTTFTCKAPNAILCDIERGSDKIENVYRDKPDTYEDVLTLMDDLEKGNHKFETLILDSLDRLEPLVWKYVCETYSGKGPAMKNIEAFGYGKGYSYAKEVWENLTKRFDILRDKGINILLVAHNQVRTFQDPIQNAGYDRNILKLHERSTGCLKEWAEVMLFADFETITYKDDNQKTRARSDSDRVMYTEKRAAFDAKSRVALPFEMPVDFNNFILKWNEAHGKKVTKESLNERIDSLLRQVNDPEVITWVEDALKKKKNNTAKKLTEMVERLETVIFNEEKKSA